MNRRALLATATLGGLSALLSPALAAHAAVKPPIVPAKGYGLFVAADGEGEAIVPIGGAGIYDVDADQDDMSQDPNETVVGDTDALPEDTEL